MLSLKRTFCALLAVLCIGIIAFGDDASLVVAPDSLFFRQLTSTPPAPLTVKLTAEGGTLGSFTATATSTGNWLSVSPASGSGPATLTVSVDTTGLAPGEYSGTIDVTAQGFTSAKLEVELDIMPVADKIPVSPPSVLMLRPDNLEFHVAAGGDAPRARQLAIFNPAGDAFSWTAAAAVSTPSGGNWLSVTPASGTGKALLSVQVDPTGLAAGQYDGTITVTSGSDTATTNVTLDVGAAQPVKLDVTPEALNFIVEPNSSGPPPTRILRVRSTRHEDEHQGGAPTQWSASAVVDQPAGGTWLSVSPLTGNTPGTITVQADPTGLSAGMYSGKVVVTTDTDSESVRVFLRVLGPRTSKAVVTPRVLHFTATTGANGVVSPDSATININSAASGLTFTATATTAKGGAWLNITPDSGSVPGSITATVDPSVATGLAPGFYTGSIQITLSGTDQEVRTLFVGLKVCGPDENPRLELEPGGMAFKAVVGGSNPSDRQVTLEPEGTASLAWTSTVTVASPSGGSWLSISPASGTTTAATNSVVTVSADITGLAAGTYSGTVVFTPDPASGAPAVQLNVVLIVASSSATSSGVAPGDLVAFFTEPPDGFVGDVSEPPDVHVTVLDSTGAPVEGATVTISSSNGEPDFTLKDIGGGQYEGVFRALSGGSLVLTGSATFNTQSAPPFGVSGDLESSADQPTVIAQGGAVNAASFAPSPTPVAPGSLISLFGKNIAGQGGMAAKTPLPTDLDGVTVTIGGIPAPLLAADSNSGQINLQVPFELNGQAEADIVVNNNGVLSQPETLQIGNTPALFTMSQTGSGLGAFLHSGDYAPISSSNPAQPGEVILLYATGLGALQTPVASGNTTSGIVRVAGNVTVTIGGLPAQVQFAGLAPGFVGLYQINVEVPAGLPPGDAQVVVTVDGTQATGQVTVPVR